MSHQQTDPEVVPSAKRRTFSNRYKLRILAEVDQAQGTGTIGAILRREGLYSSQLTDWRRQREHGLLQAGQSRKRGPKADPDAAELGKLKRENQKLKRQLAQAELIIDVQKKLSQALGLTLHTLDEDEQESSQP